MVLVPRWWSLVPVGPGRRHDLDAVFAGRQVLDQQGAIRAVLSVLSALTKMERPVCKWCREDCRRLPGSPGHRKAVGAPARKAGREAGQAQFLRRSGALLMGWLSLKAK